MNPEDMFEGFMKGRLLVKVRDQLPTLRLGAKKLQGYLHVFISPSAALDDGGGRSARTGNGGLHGITKVTIYSIVYIAVLVSSSRFLG